MADQGENRGRGTRAFGTPAPKAGPAPVAPPTAPTQVASRDDAGDPLVGQTLAGRYFIERKLGEGGMGSVYLGLHVALEKRVALKVLHGEFVRKPDLIERFLQEAKAASRIRHDNVIDITDFGQTDDGLVFFAMELLDGNDLAETMGHLKLAGQRMPWARSRHIFLQICAALAAAHAKGIVHRDLKPENIYLIERLGQTDFVKLLDFGIAKLTEVNEEGRKLTKTGMLFGTPEYMSPEQARGEKVDHRVDIYSMGCILFQMIAGRVPFEADNFMGILTMHLTKDTPRLGEELAVVGAPPALDGIVQRALAKEKEQRYGSIDELVADILALDDGLGNTFEAVPRAATGGDSSGAVSAPIKTQWTGAVRLPPATPAPTAAPAGGSRAGLYAVVGVVAAAAIGGGVYALTRGGGEPAAPPPAVVEPEPGAATGDAPAAAARVSVVVTSKPRGAQIRNTATGQIVGVTPRTLDLDRSDAPILFELTLEGHEPYDLTITPSANGQKDVELVKTSRGSRGKSDRGKADRPGEPVAKGDEAGVKPPPPPGDPGHDCAGPNCDDPSHPKGSKSSTGLKSFEDAIGGGKP